jgi:hypothetical protein
VALPKKNDFFNETIIAPQSLDLEAIARAFSLNYSLGSPGRNKFEAGSLIEYDTNSTVHPLKPFNYIVQEKVHDLDDAQRL